jgi:2-keto-4-pentenoate hydratase/2-oxohepta-3-ene-1,7-dioic acid hydratase in catechol pathway
MGVLEGDLLRALEGNLHDGPAAGRRLAQLADVRLLAPCQPGKIIAVGRNYAAHAAEHDAEVPAEPLVFLKPPSAVIGAGDQIILPPQSERVEHEAELALVIGRRGRRIPRESSLEHVLGYTCGNDVTARDLQRSDGQWTRAKGFDTFCPLGPWIETDLDPRGLAVTGSVNGLVRQRGNSRQMVFDVATLVSYISSVMTLKAGDVILTGTPAGVGPLAAGDVVTVEVEGIGVLSNPVAAE